MSKVYATMSGFVGHEGRSVDIHEGDEYDEDHPLVKAAPQCFKARAGDGEPKKRLGQTATLRVKGTN